MRKMTNNAMVKANGGRWYCTRCGYSSSNRNDMSNHLKREQARYGWAIAYWWF